MHKPSVMWQEENIPQDFLESHFLQSRVPQFFLKNFKKLRYNRKRSLSNSQPILSNLSELQKQSQPQKVQEMEQRWQNLKPRLSNRSKSNGAGTGGKCRPSSIQARTLNHPAIANVTNCSTTRHANAKAIDKFAEFDDMDQIGSDDDCESSPKINQIRIFENIKGVGKSPSHRAFYFSSKGHLDVSSENVSTLDHVKPGIPNVTNKGAVNSRKAFPLACSIEGDGILYCQSKDYKKEEQARRIRSTSTWQINPAFRPNLNPKSIQIELSNCSISANQSSIHDETSTTSGKQSLCEAIKAKQIAPSSARASKQIFGKENQSALANKDVKLYGDHSKKNSTATVSDSTTYNSNASKLSPTTKQPHSSGKSVVVVVKEEPDKENEDTEFSPHFLIDADAVLNKRGKIKKMIQARYKGSNLDEVMNKLYEAALAQKYAMIQFEKVKIDLLSNCSSHKALAANFAKSKNSNSRNVSKFAKIRPESCAKIRNSLIKTMPIPKNVVNNSNDSRPVSILKPTLFVV